MRNDQESVELEKRSNESKVRGFNTFWNKETTRLMLSLLPAGDKADVIEALLKEAFNAGHSSGEANMLCEILTKSISRRS